MAKHKQRLIFKLSSKELRKGGWKLNIKLTDAETSGLLTPIAESTVIRWMDELNNAGDVDTKIHECISEIRRLGKERTGNDARTEMRRLYREKLRLLLVEDYVNVVMDSNKDYRELCAHGFMLNGMKFVRLLSTTNGVKMKTVVFCSERLHPILRFRLDNGRNLEKPIVPAKFGAYEALACSSSTPLSWPDGILVVSDCYTDFAEDVITLDDNPDGEPIMKRERNYKIHKDASDGFGTMTPERAAAWSQELGISDTVSGMNMRCAFLKGMLVPFDHIAFAEKFNGASDDNPDGYMVRDVWGDLRDVRDCDVIFTESMLKLWSSYKSLEDYLDNCRMNHYCISTTKQAPLALDPMWTTNYQFLQSYELSDEDIQELVQPTIDGIKDVLGGDYRKLLLYLCGRNITTNTFYNSDSGFVKALMINPDEIRDPYVRQSVSRLIRKRINQAKMGKLDVHGHFEIACGDPFSLWQSIFGLPVTGILKAGEVYSEFWQDSDEVLLFRSPMSVHNNIRKMRVCHSDKARYWYRDIKTMVILNSWDTATDAMNGQDYDGDLNFVTDNPVLLRNTKTLPTIMCVQHSGTKQRVEPRLLVEADMNGFGNKIGKITNDITSQFDILADIHPDSIEAKQLGYRIMCGQKFQQDEIDKTKGILTIPRPSHWFNYRENAPKDGDTKATLHHKKLNETIAVQHKPYFMTYNYSTLRREYNEYMRAVRAKCMMQFRMKLEDLLELAEPNEEQEKFVRFFKKLLPVTTNGHVVNRISEIIENEFKGTPIFSLGEFDSDTLKSGGGGEAPYYVRKNLTAVYKSYVRLTKQLVRDDEATNTILKSCVRQCDSICPNKEQQANFIIDTLYKAQGSKKFAWLVCGDWIINNMLTESGGVIRYPVSVSAADAEFWYQGRPYAMVERDVWGGDYDYTDCNE